MRNSVKIRCRLVAISLIQAVVLMQTGQHLFAESQDDNPTTVIDATNCKETHETFPIPIPRTDSNGQLSRDMVVRARYQLQENLTLEVTEKPHAHTENDVYNSAIVVRQVNHTTEYELARLIKRGGYFRLLHASSFCSLSGQGFLILAFQAGWTSDWEAFVLVRWSQSGINVKAFPTVSQGKIVVKRADPKDFELWSAVDADMTACTACPKHYQIQDCQMDGNSILCKKRSKIVGPFSPEALKEKEITLK